MVEFRLPLVTPHMSEAIIESLHAVPGTPLKTGAKLLDLSVDLSGAFAQDCPPISFFRIVLRETVALRRFLVEPGVSCKAGDLIAIFSTSLDEADDAEVQRGVRIAIAGIMHHADMFTGNAR